MICAPRTAVGVTDEINDFAFHGGAVFAGGVCGH
jgi:hypothetical protein